tara:strand:- start:986 stop:1093 length:108 start_codon:yes stop_codon:yes gene_type:complete
MHEAPLMHPFDLIYQNGNETYPSALKASAGMDSNP